MTQTKKLWTAPDGSKWEQQSLDAIWHGDEYIKTNVGLKPVREWKEMSVTIQKPEPDFSEVDNIIKLMLIGHNKFLSQTEQIERLTAYLTDLTRAIVKLARQK